MTTHLPLPGSGIRSSVNRYRRACGASGFAWNYGWTRRTITCQMTRLWSGIHQTTVQPSIDDPISTGAAIRKKLSFDCRKL